MDNQTAELAACVDYAKVRGKMVDRPWTTLLYKRLTSFFMQQGTQLVLGWLYFSLQFAEPDVRCGDSRIALSHN